MAGTISPRKLEAAMSAAQQIKELLPYDDDNKLLIDTVDGETDVFEIIDKLAELAIADKALAEKAAERAKRIAGRSERNREVIKAMMQALDIPKLERPLATLSISQHRELQVIDEAELPAEFVRHSPDKVAIAKALRAGFPVSGATLGNDQPRLTIRTA